jgi:hypothetical protein
MNGDHVDYVEGLSLSADPDLDIDLDGDPARLLRKVATREWSPVVDNLTAAQCNEMTRGWRVINGTLRALQYLQCRQHKDCQHIYRKKYDRHADLYSIAENGTHADEPNYEEWKVIEKSANLPFMQALTEQYHSRGGSKKSVVSACIHTVASSCILLNCVVLCMQEAS